MALCFCIIFEILRVFPLISNGEQSNSASKVINGQEVMSPTGSHTPILCRWSDEMFCPSLAVRMS